MPANDENFDAPDADIILRALGPPRCDFRVHKLVLSLASPVFKDMFSLPQPPSENPKTSTVTKIEIVEVTDPTDALDIILRIIYPFTPPSCYGDLDTLVECLTIADKYDIRGAKSRLCSALARVNSTQSLRVYAIAARFGFVNLADSASRHIFSSVHLAGIPELPDDFDFVSATAYHKLVKRRASYLEAVADVINKTSLASRCYNCQGEKYFLDVLRLRLAHLIATGTPVEGGACVEAWAKAYWHDAECKGDCALKFISSAISRVEKKW